MIRLAHFTTIFEVSALCSGKGVYVRPSGHTGVGVTEGGERGRKEE